MPKNAGTGWNSGILWLFKSEMSESTTFPGGSQLGGPQLGCFFQPRIANPMDLVQDWEAADACVKGSLFMGDLPLKC